jgi:gliding motility-associated-like protein
LQSGSAVVTINPLPTATIGGTVAVCKDAASPNITFTGAGGTVPYTFTYTLNSGSHQTVSTTSGNSVTVAVPTGTAGIFTYALVSVRDGSSTACSQIQGGSATVTVNPLPTATIIGTTSVCRNGASPNITFTGSSGTAPYTFIYTINGGSNQTVSTTTGSSVTVSVPTGTAGTFTYSLVSVRDASSTSCLQLQSGSAVVTVNPLPTATISGTTAVCRNGSSPNITFTGAAGTAPYTFTYTINGGSGQTVTTSAGSSVTVSVPTIAAGTFTYALVSVRDASSTSCLQSQSGSVVVTVNPLPTATISGTAVVCEQSASPEITFTGASGTAPYTFIYRINGGSNQTITTSVGNSIKLSVPTSSPGIFTYSLVSVLDASSTLCSQPQAGSATVTVDAFPVAISGPGGNECDLNFKLNATPTFGTGIWTKTTGPGTAAFAPNANDPGATVTVSVYGTYTFTWTENNGTCTNSSTITVNFYRQPIANAGSGGNECDLNFKFSAVPSFGTGTWTIAGGPGTGIFSPGPTSPTATVTVSSYGTYQFRWTELNGTCSNSAVITVNFYEQPIANPGTGGNNCGQEFFLNAVPSVGTGTWTRTAGPGTAVFSPNPNTPDAMVTVSAYGVYTFTWTEVNGTCSNSASTNIDFILAPSAEAGTGGEECDLDFVFNAVQGTGTGTWTVLSGPGNAVFSPNANQSGAKVTVDQFGSYEFSWTEVNSTCKSSDIVSVVFRNIPAISAGKDTIICENSTVQLQATGVGSFLWDNATLLNDPAISNPVATPLVSTIFKVTLTDQFGCFNSDEVEVEVWNNPVADAGPDLVLEYLFETKLEAKDLSSNETGVWSITSGTGQFSDADSSKTIISGLKVGENIVLWNVTNGVCQAEDDYLIITVRDFVSPTSTLITPNNDGKNDYLILKGIETLGKTELIIFDRRGAQVYKSLDYNNDWDGIDYNGNPIPDDTYFYVLKSENGKSISGFFVIRR